MDLPDGFDFHHTGGGVITEMGGQAGSGDLVVACPTLAASFPHGEEAPTITAAILKNGTLWARGCGAHTTDGPGVYRVQVDITPLHLTPFLGEDSDPYLRPFP